jgi:hypothetical protein
MSTKFEQLLDLLVNEEMDKANELFHEIVVEQSRSIYENLIAEEEEEEMDEASDEDDESVDEAEEEDEESVEENMDLEDSYMMDGDDEKDTMGGDPSDDLGGDVGMDDMGGDDEGGEDSAIMDIKNAIEELEAAFAELEMAHGGGDADMSFGSDEEKPGMGDEDEGMMMGMHEGRRMTREYVEKVGNDWEKNSQKTDGDYAGAGTGEKQSKPVAGKSPVSSGKGKPTTGATAGNIAKSDTGEGNNTGTSPTGKTGGLVKNAQDMKTGNGNVPGGKMGVKNLSKVGSGYPGNNKTPGPVGSGTGDKAGQTSVGQAKSPINGAPNRNA